MYVDQWNGSRSKPTAAELSLSPLTHDASDSSEEQCKDSLKVGHHACFKVQ